MKFDKRLAGAACGFALGVACFVPALPSVRAQEPLDANIFVKLSKKIVPSVVNISTLTTVKGGYGQASPEDILRKFFGDLFRNGPNGVGPRGGGGDEDEDDSGPPLLPPGAPP